MAEDERLNRADGRETHHIVAPRLRALDCFAREIEAWFEQHLPQGAAPRLVNMTYPSGAGMSHETILFDLCWSRDGETVRESLVARIKPIANMIFPDDLFDKQYHVMKRLYEGSWLPVAEPLWFEADASVIGSPFFIMRRVRGRVPVSRPPYASEGWIADASPRQRAKLWENGVRALAAVARVPLSDMSFLADEDGTTGLAQEWRKYCRFVEWVSADRRWPILEAARDALDAWRPATSPPGLVWGGAELVNLMFDDDFQVVAMMDWEQPSLGGPLNDLAWWLFMSDLKHSAASGRSHLEGMGTREETITLWSELTGLSAEGIEWHEDFMALKIGCLAASSSRVWDVPPPDHADLARRLNLRVSG